MYVTPCNYSYTSFTFKCCLKKVIWCPHITVYAARSRLQLFLSFSSGSVLNCAPLTVVVITQPDVWS